MNSRLTVRPALPAHHGFTLTELLVVIATASVLLSVAITTLTLLMRAEQTGTAGISSSVSLSRLANDFRRDVRAASAGEVSSDEDGRPGGLRLTLATDRHVVYELRKSTIIRREISDSDDRSLRVEAYAIDARSLRFELPAAEPSRLLTMQVTSGLHDQLPTRGRSVTAAPRAFFIEATLGADRRFEK
jgi:prepilin-type N-terminal cleavage/methylation domain-containing protein